MSKLCNILLLLIALVASSSVSAQKKNSISYHIGILNHFYDENPVLFHADHIQYVNRPRDIATKLLIRSRGLNYTRMLDEKSTLSVTGAFFDADYTRSSVPSQASVIKRKWYFGTIEYNRKFLSRPKLNLFYGAGLTYRSGFQGYFVDIDAASGVGLVHSGFTESVTTSSLGTVLNAHLKYNFWRSFFLYSKLDTQLYFYKSKVAKRDFIDLQNKYTERAFAPIKIINHTLTIGLGIDF